MLGNELLLQQPVLTLPFTYVVSIEASCMPDDQDLISGIG